MKGIRAGQRFGQWVIAGEEPLGAGGNGQVLRAEAADGPVRAIKILSTGGGAGGRDRLGRFSDEIAFLAAHPHIPGVLPLLDSHIPDAPGEASWYVMPIARPIREALGSDPDPAVVVGAVGEIAATLASLAAEGMAHRDIRPDNLFELDGRWVIGDFGLVTYPDKDPRTQHGRKLGPLDYMAPRCARLARGESDRRVGRVRIHGLGPDVAGTGGHRRVERVGIRDRAAPGRGGAGRAARRRAQPDRRARARGRVRRGADADRARGRRRG